MEETYRFLMLEVLKVPKRIKSPFLYRFLPKKVRQRKKEERIRNKLPVEKEEITAYGQLGLKVTLPYSYADFEAMEREEASGIFLRIIE
ncbi:MAG TPA: hypothetical protein IAC41_02595, partial [Candidatus Merdenecus merdavium]|nr:hypothetical protein [Candidatus Merdenecus merdavium]